MEAIDERGSSLNVTETEIRHMLHCDDKTKR